MKTDRWFLLFLAAGAGTAGSPLRAQNVPPGQRLPNIGYVYPAGAQRGAALRVEVGGQFFDGVGEARFSGDGVKATVVKHTKMPTQREINRIQDKLKEAREELRNAPGARRLSLENGTEEMLQALAERAGVSVDDLIAIRKFREARNDPKKQPNPQLGETVLLDLEISPEARPGERELRLITPAGVSDPVRFRIGRLPEFREEEPNDRTGGSAPALSLPATCNGQILPGDVDRFRFSAKKGQNLVVAASARELIPHLADAVPGWFQATLALYDLEGRELAYSDDFRFNPDPVFHYLIPEDGSYEIEIKDAIYRGREDFVYRITLGELPFVTSIFPMGGRAGSEISVDLDGWNLPADRITLDTRDRKPGVEALAMVVDEPLMNLTPFAVDTLPEVVEAEPNNDPGTAMELKPPSIVNGRIGEAGDWDVYRFSCRKGGRIFAEIKARRLNSPVDSVLFLTDAGGQRIAANDDHEDKGAGLVTHHADSRIGVTIPADGTYYLHVGDTQRNGGKEFAYRLHLNAQRPDFELRVTPSSVSARAGTAVTVTAHVLRRDGFEGDVRLALKGAPPGFALSGGWIPAGHESLRMTLTVPSEATGEPVVLAMEGRATIGDREVVRDAVPAEDMMQAFAYHHLVPAKAWMVLVGETAGSRFGGKSRFRGRGPSPEPATSPPVVAEPVSLAADGATRVLVPLPMAGRVPGLEGVELALSDPPEGIALGGFSFENDSVALQIQVESGKVKPGLKGNLIIDASLEKGAAEGKGEAKRFRIPLGVLPAVPFEVGAAPR